jgi:hypothetical protein
MITQLHRDFNNFSANSAQHIASNTKKTAYFREEPTSSHCIGRPSAFPSVSEPDFQWFYTSSRPRRYWQRTQLSDPVKDFPKKCPRYSHFRHLATISGRSVYEDIWEIAAGSGFADARGSLCNGRSNDSFREGGVISRMAGVA